MIGPQLPPGWAGGQQQQEEEEEASGAAQSRELVCVTELGHLFKVSMGAGLHNLGNSCYMNSVLQCLAYVPPLCQAALHRKLHGFTCPCPLRRKGVPCAACLLEQQLSSQLGGTQRATRPEAVWANLQLFAKGFVRGRQEDAHEFLLAVLDAVERDSRRGLLALGMPKSRRTLVEGLFCGRLVSSVRCLECGHLSCSYELLTSLSLDLAGSNSVEQSLRRFSAQEVLEGANKYKCDKCNKLVRAHKSLHVHEQPNVLAIHLKRFNALTPLTAKVSRPIAFSHTLSLQPHTLQRHQQQGNGAGPPAKQGPIYLLSGVVVHAGPSLHSGHYYAYVRDSAGAWFCANDSTVQRVALDHVLKQQAYLLFYTRTAIKPLAPPPAPDTAPTTAAPLPKQPSGGPAANGSGNGHPPHRPSPLQPKSTAAAAPASSQVAHDQQAGPARPAGPVLGSIASSNTISCVQHPAGLRVTSLGPAKTSAVLQPKAAAAPTSKADPSSRPAAGAARPLAAPAAAAAPGPAHAMQQNGMPGHADAEQHAKLPVDKAADEPERKRPRHHHHHHHHHSSHDQGRHEHDRHGNGRGDEPREDGRSTAGEAAAPGHARHVHGREGVANGSMLGKHPRSASGEDTQQAALQRANGHVTESSREVTSPYADSHGGQLAELLRATKCRLLDDFRSNAGYKDELRVRISEFKRAGGSLQELLARGEGEGEGVRVAARPLAPRLGGPAVASAAQQLSQGVTQLHPESASQPVNKHADAQGDA